MRRFGLIGRPLGHSASAAYFAAKFEREGIADCTYTLYELPEIGALERLLAETPDLCGFNVTIPYKREVMALLDDLSHDARLVGAVNCVRRTADSRLVGHNTDVIGLRAAFDCLLGGEQPRMPSYWVRVGRRRPCSMCSPSGASRSTSCHVTPQRATTPTTTCRARPWSRAAS